MAVGNLPDPPESLAETYYSVVSVAKRTGDNPRRYSIAPNVRARQPDRPPGYPLELINAAVDWLTDQHAAGMSHQARSAFRAARRAELDQNQFPAPWWHECVINLDRTELGYPSVYFNVDPPPVEYNDPDRQPTYCKYYQLSSAYSTPEGEGTPEQPGPGWRGEVIDYYFRDLWLAQRSLRFVMPTTISPADQRPLIIHSDIEVSARASTRGNRVWFTVSQQTRFYTSNVAHSAMVYWWPRPSTWRFPIPGDAPGGWSHAEQISHWRNARNAGKLYDWQSFSRILLKQITAPSRGQYFSRNDWAEVHWIGPVKLHAGVPANG